jgi:hypothetical protein
MIIDFKAKNLATWNTDYLAVISLEAISADHKQKLHLVQQGISELFRYCMLIVPSTLSLFT